ncbi:NAD(P)H-quinone oxidoreductase subunit F [Prochlorothrix hollandica]|uniref:NAD(P)H-quinone oxidoreductase subunit F n=1 Tax=Prochlorothrix hollandica PCC 9006 = CALU 1027 TaxID=317619 RepID=A0A0M2Q284_PROHO|nr:NAD(P)H-quinone oxidoreductase subunit F [Prochlorothrix hollandica]KKJ00737.1 NAD(P)H-quinone oxidoreductase subunit F [Prochlorothrix hollandica PCC 9006 = CALU 1027]
MAEFLLKTSWFIPFYGLIGAVLTLPWSINLIRRTGPRPAAYFNLFMTSLACLHGSVALPATWGMVPQQLTFEWLSFADLDLSLVLEISSLNMGALTLVTAMSLLTQLYALGYLEKEWSLARFFGLMGFFEAALSGIALSDSLLLTYGLLEMLTLSTYLLVGFWYAQPLVVTAARDAFLTKRVGDVILLMGLVTLATYSPGLTFSEIGQWAATVELPPLTATLLGLALIAGPIGKCAQFPLHLWLDEAMEAPNPASLMRNSVVVGSGAYVLIKLQPVFALSPWVSDTLIAVGALTAIGASLVAIAQIDIKRTLSHSTSAYLGLVFVAVGLEHVDIALLLLLTHAVAKSLLFMSAGSIIFTTSNQDITEMGGLWSRMPATTVAFIVGSLGLLSLFPLGMFWTLRHWLSGMWSNPDGLILLLMAVNCLSGVNLLRVFRLVFLGEIQAKTRRIPEIGWAMALPMVSLTIITLLMPLMLERWQLLLSMTSPVVERDGLQYWGLLLIVLASALGVAIAAALPLSRTLSRPIRRSTRFLQDLLAYDFYIDRVYRVTVVWMVNTCSQVAAWIDLYVVDGIVNAVGLATILSGQGLKYSASGQSQLYVVTIMVGVGVLLVVITGGANLLDSLQHVLQLWHGNPVP